MCDRTDSVLVGPDLLPRVCPVLRLESESAMLHRDPLLGLGRHGEGPHAHARIALAAAAVILREVKRGHRGCERYSCTVVLGKSKFEVLS